MGGGNKTRKPESSSLLSQIEIYSIFHIYKFQENWRKTQPFGSNIKHQTVAILVIVDEDTAHYSIQF